MAVVVARRKDADEVAAVIARALAADPLYRQLEADQEENYRRFYPYWRAIADYALRNGIVLKDGLGRGALCLVRPGKTDFGPLDLLGTGLRIPRAILGLPLRTALRLADTLLKLEGFQDRMLPCRHYYLACLGVLPREQGRGIGKGLLSRMAEIADAEALPVYLETETERNVRLYELFGFELRRKQAIGREGIDFYCMVRE
jgi:ribosomal protein S18 acetylase RimI-like enzyme